MHAGAREERLAPEACLPRLLSRLLRGGRPACWLAERQAADRALPPACHAAHPLSGALPLFSPACRDHKKAPVMKWGEGDRWTLQLELPVGDYEFKVGR